MSLFVEIRLIKLQEDPLGPAGVFRIGGGDFAIPVIAETERFQLALEGLDVRLSRDPRVLARFDRILFSRQSEGIPTHRVEDIEAPAHLRAADDIGGRVTFRVADMQARSGRVGEHVEDEELRLRGIEVRIAGIRGAEGFFLIPDLLPLGLKLVEGERFTAFGGHESEK